MGEPSDLWIGKLLDGRYRITELIGKGGMGRVYEAEHLALSRRVAVKLLDPADMPASADPRRFAREAFAAGRLGHPNCVTVTDFGSRATGSRPSTSCATCCAAWSTRTRSASSTAT